jgi:hypothetical protein
LYNNLVFFQTLYAFQPISTISNTLSILLNLLISSTNSTHLLAHLAATTYCNPQATNSAPAAAAAIAATSIKAVSNNAPKISTFLSEGFKYHNHSISANNSSSFIFFNHLVFSIFHPNLTLFFNQ